MALRDSVEQLAAFTEQQILRVPCSCSRPPYVIWPRLSGCAVGRGDGQHQFFDLIVSVGKFRKPSLLNQDRQTTAGRTPPENCFDHTLIDGAIY